MSEEVVVAEMPRASVTPGGELAEMELKNSDGSRQVIRFSPTTMLTFVNRVFELFLNERMQKDAAAGHAEINALPVTTTLAQAAVGGRAVIVGLRLQNGLPVSFSIQPAEAEEFERQLGKAIKKGRQESLKGRH
jgi:hypothetical protein